MEIVSVIITAIVSPLLVIWLKNYYSSKKPKLKKSTIKEHPFFSEIQYMIDISIEKINIEDDILRTKMIRKFLKIKLLSTQKNFGELTNSSSLDVDSSLATCDYINCITKIVRDYEMESIKNNVPEVFIRRFSEWHTPKIIIIRDLIEYICRSNIYDTDTEKLSAILDIVLMVLHLTMMDAEDTIKSMNGELTKQLEKLHQQKLANN